MKTRNVQLKDQSNSPIAGSKGLVWGNNAAWLCHRCSTLNGGRTGDTEHVVQCSGCESEFVIERAENRSGRLHLGPAVGISLVK